MNHSEDNDDYNAFLKEMADVTPVKRKILADIQKSQAVTPGQQVRKAAAEDTFTDPNFLSLLNPKMVKPHDFLVWKRDGVQEGVFKKLRLGKYEIEARLDLHHKTGKEARESVFQLINDCREHELRTVLIAHGRGEKSNPPALLKSLLYTWLPQMEAVLACHSALKFHGGSGALYVLLRKSEREKLENRERHAKRTLHGTI
ncbi:DNA endonuclease SmrA [Endozoicomonas ascidiicola]|uniref:DNA endonuclease SmrA n=1 Tax=Endozoicomonas ascidiicola TaxID=1698521 RepID=UPI00082DE533|nr:DNA endonuclease SmrA [Endozoicomonas ascidiicola]